MRVIYAKRVPTIRGWCSGFSLIEVLITLLILSLGLVGLAALQLTAVKNVHSSLLTTTATAAALDFEERAWIRLASLESGCVEVDAFRAAFVADWTVAPERLGLPGFQLTAPHADTLGWRDFSLTLSWVEGRFDDFADEDEDSDARESFAFNVRVPCR